MKDERKNIEIIAEQLLILEKQCQSKNNVSDIISKIEQITMNLSLEEMLEIDEYIMKKILTK